MQKKVLKKAVIYCRVSTKEQVEEGNSLVTQERICNEYAQKHGFEVAATFIEQGESAKNADRTELKKLLSFCTSKKNHINAVIAYKIDRISRNTDDYSQIRIALKRYGVEIKSTSEYFEDTPSGRFMENIIANVAQFDNDVRTERSIGGMKEAMREGRYVWNASYGYSNVRVNGKATIAPNKFAIFVQKAYSEVSKQEKTINTIRESLINEGMLTNAGKPISKTTFYDLLRNELYTGWINKFGEKTKGQFEPIITEQLFYKVQTILTNNKNTVSRKTDSEDFPLRRFFKHQSGKAFTGCWSQGKKKKYPYYLVHGTKLIIRKEVLENAFKKWLTKYFRLDVSYYEKLLEKAKSFAKFKVEARTESEIEVKQDIKSLKDKQSSILEKNLSGVISDTFCKAKLAELESQVNELEENLSALLNRDSIDYTEVLKLT